MYMTHTSMITIQIFLGDENMKYYRNITDEKQKRMLWEYQISKERFTSKELQELSRTNHDISRAIQNIDRKKTGNSQNEEEYGFSDLYYKQDTFDKDDLKDKESSNMCRKYVENFVEMYDAGIGILFYGGIGAGKTFLANSIINALQSYHVSALATSFPRLLNIIFASKNKQELIDKLMVYDLLFIDDFGTERGSQYSSENVYNIVNARCMSGKPMIVTTNLTMDELKSSKDINQTKIYSRLLEACPAIVKMVCDDRRRKKMEDKQNTVKKYLFGT